MKIQSIVLLLVAACCFSIIACAAAGADIRKDATDFTIAANLKANNTPAWNNNEEDFNFSHRGFIATVSPLAIPADIPNITAWNASAFRYFENGSRSDTINPLL